MNENQITIILPTSNRWMHILLDGVELYAKTLGFPESLKDNIMNSTTEACEELIRIATETDEREPVHITLDYKGEAVIIEIEYSSKINLNPFDVDEYEIPDETTDLDSVSLEAFWLFLIKKQMDRVFFRVRGNRRVLSIMQYKREEGQEGRIWAMAIKPELAKGVSLHFTKTNEGLETAVLQKSGGGALMLNPSETFFVKNMDGLKSFHDLFMDHVDVLGLTSPNLPAALYEKLESLGALISTDAEEKQSRIGRLIKALANLSYSIPKADEKVTKVERIAKPLFSHIGVTFMLLVGISGLAPAWVYFDRIVEAISNLEAQIYLAPQIILILYLLSLIQVSLHELGHGVVCKHFGGAVPRMGIMFYLGSFIFFCDTTSSYTFVEKRQRILVSLGGPLLSFSIFGMGLWVFAVVAGQGSIWEYVFVAFGLLNFFLLVMNFNPFIKMDAYYILMDLTEIQNLRERSFRFLKRKLLGWIGFGEDEDTKATLTEQRLFWWYGLLGGLMTAVFIVLPVFPLVYILSKQSLHGGRTLLAIVLGALLLVRLASVGYKSVKAMRYKDFKVK